MEEQSKGGESQLLFFGSNAAQGIREVNSLPHLLLTSHGKIVYLTSTKQTFPEVLSSGSVPRSTTMN